MSGLQKGDREMRNKGLYAGTFDPITNGHLWIIDEATEIFDHVVVAVADNPDKRGKTMFSAAERVKMVEESCFGMNGVEVVTYAGECAPPFTARFAKGIGATHLIRGIRNESDFGSEQVIRHINQDICPSVKTMFMIPPRHLSEVSSSMVKGLVGFQGWRGVIERYVQYCVVKRFQARRLDADEVMLRLGASYSCAVAAKDFLNKVYQHKFENHRSYHDLRHIQECLALLRRTVSDRHVSPEAFDEMAAALWFHDCIYDTVAKDNEVQSSNAFGGFAGDIQTDVVMSIKRMIELTQGHEFCGEHKVNLVSDIDMAILGASKDRFDEYESCIRREYADIPDAVFYPARKQFLQKCLTTGVFHTELFKLFCSQMADNIKRLLESEPYANLKGAK